MSKAGSQTEDTIPEAYLYYWDSGNASLSIEEFVKKFKPSMVQNDGTKPWLWVQNSNATGNVGKREVAITEATKILADATERVQEINDDDTIPSRSSKKTGAKSKKQVREEVQVEMAQVLKDIHGLHDYKSGKWLAFVPPDMVDTVWSRIATSVATGPLSETVVYLAKVATTPPNESSAQRVIYIYMPDVFDKEKVTEVMRILIRNHGLNLSGVKSNLYTDIGLDSKHPSRIQSTVWKNTDLLKVNQIKELKDAFFADLKIEQEKSSTGSGAKKVPSKPKPATDDPFGSSEEEEPEVEKVKKTTSKRKTKDEEEVGGRPKKKTR